MPMNDILLTWMQLEGRSGHDAGRELLARAYREKTGQECPEIRVLDRGKPYFANSGLHFSISHTSRHAFCALSSHPVGIDAEETDRKINLKLAGKILSPAERARFDGTREMLLRFWVLKEAAAKLTGDGLKGYPNGTDFDPEDPRIQIIDGCFVAVLQNYSNDEGENHAV